MHFISTSGHGYLKISLKQFEKAYKVGFRPTPYSYINHNTVLLEEDIDSFNYLCNFNKKKYEQRDKIRVVHQKDINRMKYYITLDSTVEFTLKICKARGYL